MDTVKREFEIFVSKVERCQSWPGGLRWRRFQDYPHEEGQYSADRVKAQEQVKMKILATLPPEEPSLANLLPPGRPYYDFTIIEHHAPEPITIGNPATDRGAKR